MLEAGDYEDNAFVTLTYADAPRSLVPEHLRDWLKRIRGQVSPRRLRFFGVGEYGEQSWRPHYHVALFNYPSCAFVGLNRGDCPCEACTVVRKTWGFGHVLVGRLERSSAQYVAGYVVKKLTCADDLRLCGRYPEFARMSLKPGIGANAMWDVASEMMRYEAEVPLRLNSGRTGWPLGRYLRNRLKEMTGRETGATPEELHQLAESLQAVREFAWANDRSVRSVFEELNEGYETRVDGRLSNASRRAL